MHFRMVACEWITNNQKVATDYTAKVGDFGLSMLSVATAKSDAAVGTLPYMVSSHFSSV